MLRDQGTGATAMLADSDLDKYLNSPSPSYIFSPNTSKTTLTPRNLENTSKTTLTPRETARPLPKLWGSIPRCSLGRMRPDFNVISWHSPRDDARSRVPTSVVLAKLQPWHVEMNTTRALTPGLLIAELGEDGGRIPLPDYENGRGFLSP